jgi:hypothetical protein
MNATLHFSPSRCRMRQAVMERDDRQMQRTFNRHNEKCNGGFCCLSVLEDCLVQCLAECIVSRHFDEIGVIETGAEGMR